MRDRPILLVGGAPRLSIDVVRHLTVGATGRTCLRLAELLAQRGAVADLLLSQDSVRADAYAVQRYTERGDLDERLRVWIGQHPHGAVVMSAAVNDYQVSSVQVQRQGQTTLVAPGGKISSGADEILIRLVQAPKLIDQLRGWGLRGPLIGFKHEAAATVVASAQRLRERVGAQAVLANALDGSIQALVTGSGVHDFVRQRDAALAALVDLLLDLA